MYVPALFCVVRGDSFISNWHSDLLHANYAGNPLFSFMKLKSRTIFFSSGDKFILAVDGDHNEVRPPSMHVCLCIITHPAIDG